MIDTVIFDIGNVLVGFSGSTWERFLQNHGADKEDFEKISDATVRSDDWSEYDKGILTDAQIIDLFVENDPLVENQIRSTFTDLKGVVDKRDYAIDWIKGLKDKGMKVLYLSNFSKTAEHDNPDAMSFLSYTDGGILSYKDKVIKPDPAIYRLLIERYDLVPENCVFVDDTQKNLDAAEKIGIKTILFTEIGQVRRQLDEIMSR